MASKPDLWCVCCRTDVSLDSANLRVGDIHVEHTICGGRITSREDFEFLKTQSRQGNLEAWKDKLEKQIAPIPFIMHAYGNQIPTTPPPIPSQTLPNGTDPFGRTYHGFKHCNQCANCTSACSGDSGKHEVLAPYCCTQCACPWFLTCTLPIPLGLSRPHKP